MKKDIEIPEVEKVFLAAVKEQHEDFQSEQWNIYLINSLDEPIETVLIVSQGYDNEIRTSVMRHSLKVLPSKSFARIELLQEELASVNNEFSVSFFKKKQLLHKKFILKKDRLNLARVQELPLLDKKGILLE